MWSHCVAIALGVILSIVLVFFIFVYYHYRQQRRRTTAPSLVLPVSTVTPTLYPSLPPQPPPHPIQYTRNCCLLCHIDPKIGEYDFCGETCRQNALSNTPLLMEVPPNHVTFQMVLTRFSSAWNCPMRRPCPQLKKVFKIVESPATRAQYDLYKSKHGNEVFRYHGTSRECRVGETGNHYPCWSNTCPACCILRTSFKVSLANPAGAFGQGIYTSSAPNKSSSYSTNGVMFLVKVVMGKEYHVSEFAEVKSLPSGYHSVVFDRLGGRLNESVIYHDEAIRPVFLIIFES